MRVNIKKKEEIVSELQKKIRVASSAVVASFHGVTANSVNKLRKDARNYGVYIRVVSNSLLHRAVSETIFECLSELFVKDSVVAFSIRNPNDAARVFLNFSKDCENFKIKGAAFEGKFISVDKIDLLSNLPDYSGAILRFISILQIISIGNLIKLLKELSNREVK